MNATQTTASKKTRSARRMASNIVTRRAYGADDCAIMNRGAELLIQHGALSVERLATLMGCEMMVAHWIAWHLDTETAAGLQMLRGE
jgi:hypothetical protein